LSPRNGTASPTSANRPPTHVTGPPTTPSGLPRKRERGPCQRHPAVPGPAADLQLTAQPSWGWAAGQDADQPVAQCRSAWWRVGRALQAS
jgi:hypothetical protein